MLSPVIPRPVMSMRWTVLPLLAIALLSLLALPLLASAASTVNPSYGQVLFEAGDAQGGSAFNGAVALQYDSTGALYVIDYWANGRPRLQKLSPSGVDVTATFRASNSLNLGASPDYTAWIASNPTSNPGFAVAVDPTTNDVYVSPDGYTISHLSSSGTLIATFSQTFTSIQYMLMTATGAPASQLVVADGSKVYFLDPTSGSEANAQTILLSSATQQALAGPIQGFAINSANHVALYARSTGSYIVIDTNGNIINRPAVSGAVAVSPTSLWINHDTLWAVYRQSSSQVYTIVGFTSNNYNVSAATYSVPVGPMPLTLSGPNNGNWTWSDQQLATITTWSPTATYTLTLRTTLSNGQQLWPVGVSSDGMIWALDGQNDCFAQFSSTGSFVKYVPSPDFCTPGLSRQSPPPAVNPQGTTLAAYTPFLAGGGSITVWNVSNGAVWSIISPTLYIGSTAYPTARLTWIQLDAYNNVIVQFEYAGPNTATRAFTVVGAHNSPGGTTFVVDQYGSMEAPEASQFSFLQVDHHSNTFIGWVDDSYINYLSEFAPNSNTVVETLTLPTNPDSYNPAVLSPLNFTHIDDYGAYYHLLALHTSSNTSTYSLQVTTSDRSTTRTISLGTSSTTYVLTNNSVHTDVDGDVYLFDRLYNQIVKIRGASYAPVEVNPAYGQQLFAGSDAQGGSAFNGAVALQYDSTGALYVIDYWANGRPRLQKLSPSGVDVTATFRASNSLNLGASPDYTAWIASNPTSNPGFAVAVDPTTNDVYVSPDGYTISHLSSSGTLIATFSQTFTSIQYMLMTATGAPASQLVVADGSKVYFLDPTSGSEANAQTILLSSATQQALAGPIQGFAINSANHVALYARSTGSYIVIDTNGNIINRPAVSGAVAVSPTSLWINHDTLWAVYRQSSSQVYTIVGFTSNNYNVSAATYSVPVGPMPLTLSGPNNGNWTWSDQQLATITTWSPTATYTLTLRTTLSNGQQLWPVGVSSDGMIWALDGQNDCFAQFSSTGSFVKYVPSPDFCTPGLSRQSPPPAVNPQGTTLAAYTPFLAGGGSITVWNVSNGAVWSIISPTLYIGSTAYPTARLTWIQLDAYNNVIVQFEYAGPNTATRAFTVVGAHNSPGGTTFVVDQYGSMEAPEASQFSFLQVDHHSNTFIGWVDDSYINYLSEFAPNSNTVVETLTLPTNPDSYNPAVLSPLNFTHIDDYGAYYHLLALHTSSNTSTYSLQVTTSDRSTTRTISLGTSSTTYVLTNNSVHTDVDGDVYLFDRLYNQIVKIRGASYPQIASSPSSTADMAPARPSSSSTASASQTPTASATACILQYSLPGNVDYPWSVATSLSFVYNPIAITSAQGTAVQVLGGIGTRTFTNRFGVTTSTTLTLLGSSLSRDNLLFLNSPTPIDSGGIGWVFPQPQQLPGAGPTQLQVTSGVVASSGTFAEVGSSAVDPLGSAFLSSVPSFLNLTIGASNVNSLAVQYTTCQAPITFTNGLRGPTQPSAANGALRVGYSYSISDGVSYRVVGNLTLTMSSGFATVTDALGNPYQLAVNVTGTRVYTYLSTNAQVTSTVTGSTLATSSSASQRFYPYSLLASTPGVYSVNTVPFFDSAGMEFALSNTVPVNGQAPGVGPLSSAVVLAVSSVGVNGRAVLTEGSYLTPPVVSFQSQMYTLL